MTITELRSHRVGPFAIFDFAASFLGILAISPLVKNWVSRERLLWGVIPAGILAHELVGLHTPLNQMVLGPKTNILAQTVVGLMLMKTLARESTA